MKEWKDRFDKSSSMAIASAWNSELDTTFVTNPHSQALTELIGSSNAVISTARANPTIRSSAKEPPLSMLNPLDV